MENKAIVEKDIGKSVSITDNKVCIPQLKKMSMAKTMARDATLNGVKAAHKNSCHDCSKLKYAKAQQGEIDTSNKENIPDNHQCERLHNLKSIAANIDGLDVICHLNPLMEANLLREDLWQKIAREGLSSATLGINGQAKLKSNFGHDVYPLGNVILHTLIRGEIRRAEWTVVPVYSIPVEACFGRLLSKPSRKSEERALQPKKISIGEQRPIIDDLIKREVEKVRQEVERRTQILKEQRQKQLQEQIEDVTRLMEKQKL